MQASRPKRLTLLNEVLPGPTRVLPQADAERAGTVPVTSAAAAEPSAVRARTLNHMRRFFVSATSATVAVSSGCTSQPSAPSGQPIVSVPPVPSASQSAGARDPEPPATDEPLASGDPSAPPPVPPTRGTSVPQPPPPPPSGYMVVDMLPPPPMPPPAPTPRPKGHK